MVFSRNTSNNSKALPTYIRQNRMTLHSFCSSKYHKIDNNRLNCLKRDHFITKFDNDQYDPPTSKRLIIRFTLFLFGVLTSSMVPIAHTSETAYPCLNDVSKTCLYSAMKTSEDPKIKVNTKAFCFMFEVIKTDTLADKMPWQVFESLHREELTRNAKYLNGYPMPFKKNYIDQLLKALHQIAKEDCPAYVTKI